MDYKQKYLKYKQKYLDLKRQLGGDGECPDIISDVKKEVKLIKLALKFAYIDRNLNTVIPSDKKLTKEDIEFMMTANAPKLLDDKYKGLDDKYKGLDDKYKRLDDCDRLYNYALKPREIGTLLQNALREGSLEELIDQQPRLRTQKRSISPNIRSIAQNFGKVLNDIQINNIIATANEVAQLPEAIEKAIEEAEPASLRDAVDVNNLNVVGVTQQEVENVITYIKTIKKKNPNVFIRFCKWIGLCKK